MLEAALKAIERAVLDPEETPALAHRCQGVRFSGDLAPLVEKIKRTLDPLGNVRDDASPKLQSLRSKIKSNRDSLYRDLNAYLQKNQDVLGDETVSVRDGRLLVLLPSGHRGRLPGLVHGRSSTGRSFYFEPLDVVESNNDLQQAIDDEGAERRRLLFELTHAASDNSGAIAKHARLLGELDALEAAKRFAELSGGRLADISEGPEVIIIEGKHPLLDPACNHYGNGRWGNRDTVARSFRSRCSWPAPRPPARKKKTGPLPQSSPFWLSPAPTPAEKQSRSRP